MEDEVKAAEAEMGDHASCIDHASYAEGLHLSPPEHLLELLPNKPEAEPDYFDREVGEWVARPLSAEDQAFADEIAAKEAERDDFNARAMAAYRAMHP